MFYVKRMKKATDIAVEAIAKMSEPIKGKEQIARVAVISQVMIRLAVWC